jgi:hypothetical protein
LGFLSLLNRVGNRKIKPAAQLRYHGDPYPSMSEVTPGTGRSSMAVIPDGRLAVPS